MSHRKKPLLSVDESDLQNLKKTGFESPDSNMKF